MRRLFVDEYLIDLNATQAAIRAGYSAKTAASQGERLLRDPDIKRAIAGRMKAREARTEITQDKVIRELARIGFSDIRKAVKWGNTEVRPLDGDGSVLIPYHGLALISSDEIDDDTAAAIAEVSEGRNGLKVKMHDKKSALLELVKHLGLDLELKRTELELKRLEIEKRRIEVEKLRQGGESNIADILGELIRKLPG